MDIRDEIRAWWDDDAQAYDASPGHSMSDPVEAAAWRAALTSALPAPPARVLDVGSGTGALAILAAGLGHEVTALDLSERMLERARSKASDLALDVTFVVGPAEEPPPGPFDAVVARHVVWTLPAPVEALRGWHEVVRPGGVLALFEGSWSGEGPLVALKDAAASILSRAIRVEAAHHGPYPAEVLDRLPLRAASSPMPFLHVVGQAGWAGIRLVRLRDVEWAADRREPWPLGWLRHRPRYAILATTPGR